MEQGYYNKLWPHCNPLNVIEEGVAVLIGSLVCRYADMT